MTEAKHEPILEVSLLQELNKLSPKNNSAFIKGLVDEYLTQTPNRIEIMARGSLPDMASEAHVIKSTSGALGALKLQKKANQIENLLHENQTHEIKMHISEMRLIYDRTKAEMLTYIKSLT